MSSSLSMSLLLFATCVISALGAAIPPKCPPEGPVPVFFPHDASCSKYWICSHGYPIEQECAAGLHWDQPRSTCNSPSEANCQVTQPPQPTTQPSTQPPTQPPQPTTSQNPTTGPA